MELLLINRKMKIIIFVLLCITIKHASGLCFFPAEYQGIFATESSLTQGKRHVYTEVTILPEAIPIWGICGSRAGNTVILHDSTGGLECVRCFHLYLRSPNIIQVYTEGIDRCHPDEESARASCPSMQDIRGLRAREIMLYKMRSFNQDGRISREMCPFVGRYHFSYGAFDGKRRSDMCLDLSSHLSSCPRASQLKLNFRDCTFGDLDLHLECLGSWTGFDDITYLALYDPDVKSDRQPKYRCGMFHKSPSGRVALSLSVDSSCHNQLSSPWQGFESLNLSPFRSQDILSAIGKTCTFPDWAEGEWQNIKFTGHEMELRDETTDQVQTGFCLTEDPRGERFTMRLVNQCGVQTYACIWIKSRSKNVMEFILSTSEENNNLTSLCSDDLMWKRTWVTQGRKEDSEINCPIKGEYVGVIPNDRSLCAKLTTDCQRSDFMHHSVFPCGNSTVPYEGIFLQSAAESNFTPIEVLNLNDIKTHRRRRSDRQTNSQTPPWNIVGESDKYDRFYILSSEPVRNYDDSRGSRVYVFEGGLDHPNNEEISMSSRAAKLSSESGEKMGKSNMGDTASVEQKEKENPEVELERLKRENFRIAPGEEKERYYQCLGQWEEGGVIYAYTWRRDVFKYECFVGVKVTEDQAFLMEAGSTCLRGLQPLAKGMKIIKTDDCSDEEANVFLRQNEEDDVDQVSNRIEGYNKVDGPRWSRLGENQLRLSSSSGVNYPNGIISLVLILFIRYIIFICKL